MYKAMNWLIDAGDEKDRGVRVWDKLCYEMLNAAQNEVGVMCYSVSLAFGCSARINAFCS